MSAFATDWAVVTRILGPGDDEHPALSAGAATVTYGQLRGRVASICEVLARNGVESGDRIAVCLPKRIQTVETIVSVLALGAAYVPLNHHLSAVQLLRLVADLRPALLIVEAATACALRRAVQETRFSEPLRLGVMPENGVGSMEMTELRPGWAEGRSLKGPDQLSAILYTSGSTGEPKGIMLTKKNLESFVDWAATTFEIRETDRLASHAPLYFDLSIFDIFCGLTRRASVYLIDEEVGRFPGAIRSVIEKAQLTVWYSVPTALVHLQRRQALKGLQSLRHILFAGEVFPVPALRQLVAQLPTARYTNLYGPTETNVCTYYQLPASIESDDEPVPIGWPCEHLSISILDDQGSTVQHGEIGEICVSGPAVMSGYWRRPEATHSTRFKDQSDTYMTGDFAYQRSDGALMFVGRRDQQIKLRGYRIELLALQTVLNAYPGVHEASVLFVPELRRGGLAAFVVPNGSPATEADIRAFIAERLPPHYQPDYLEWLSELPRMANGKCDRARLTAMVRLAAEA